MDALRRWERALDAILAKRRHRLTGREYLALLDAIEQRGLPAELRQLAIELVRKVARHDGPSTRPPFADPALNREYVAAQRAAVPGSAAPELPSPANDTSRPQLMPRDSQPRRKLNASRPQPN
jgi:hypothetical protein